MNLKKFEPYLDNSHTFPEYILVNTQEYCGKLIIVKVGGNQRFHLHKEKIETFVVLEGTVIVDILQYTETITSKMRAGMKINIYPGRLHRFRVYGKGGIVLEISTHHSDNDTYRLEGAEEIEEAVKKVEAAVKKAKEVNTIGSAENVYVTAKKEEIEEAGKRARKITLLEEIDNE